MGDKRCIICGVIFQAPPSSKKITCGKQCSSIRKRQSHKNVSNTWNAAARKQLVKKGHTSNLKQGTPAALQSPRSGPFETNINSKLWGVRSPTAKEYEIRNLRNFCRNNAELFSPDPWQNAYAGLRQVQAWLVGKRKRKVSQWKGWTLTKPSKNGGNNNAKKINLPTR